MQVSCPRCQARHDIPRSRSGLVHCLCCASPFVTPPPRGGPGRWSSFLTLARSDGAKDQLRRTIRLWGSTARTLVLLVVLAWAVLLCGWVILTGGELAR